MNKMYFYSLVKKELKKMSTFYLYVNNKNEMNKAKCHLLLCLKRTTYNCTHAYVEIHINICHENI